MKIRVSPIAVNDLKEIKSYIENELSNPIAANNVIKRIIADYSCLEVSPYMGTPLSAKVPFETDYRFIVSGNYLVFYKVDDSKKQVIVYAVVDQRQAYLSIIRGL